MEFVSVLVNISDFLSAHSCICKSKTIYNFNKKFNNYINKIREKQ